MTIPPGAEDVPCERCLSWRIEQSNYVSRHILDVLTAILRDLGHDPNDEAVRDIAVRRLNQVDSGEL